MDWCQDGPTPGRQGGPERADEVTGAILGEVDDFFVEAVEDDERALLPHEAQQIGGGDGAVRDAPGALNDAGEQLFNGGHRAGSLADVIPQVDVDGQRVLAGLPAAFVDQQPCELL